MSSATRTHTHTHTHVDHVYCCKTHTWLFLCDYVASWVFPCVFPQHRHGMWLLTLGCEAAVLQWRSGYLLSIYCSRPVRVHSTPVMNLQRRFGGCTPEMTTTGDTVLRDQRSLESGDVAVRPVAVPWNSALAQRVTIRSFVACCDSTSGPCGIYTYNAIRCILYVNEVEVKLTLMKFW